MAETYRLNSLLSDLTFLDSLKDMSVSGDIPQINITAEVDEDEDDDRALLSLTEALTDVEDLFEEDQPTTHTPKQPKSKLKIKLPEDDGLTDLEDFETSSEEEQACLVDHNEPILLADLDIEAPITEESYQKHSKGRKGKMRLKTEFATKQKSFYQSDEEVESNEGDACTESEGYESDSNYQEDIPEAEFDFSAYRSQYLVADDGNSGLSSLKSSVSDLSEFEGTGLKIATLSINTPEQGDITDCEFLHSDTDSDTEVKKTKPRKRRNKAQRRPDTTDVENIYFSGDEREKKPIKRHKRKTKHLLAKSETMPFDSENEDNVDLPFPVCKPVAKKTAPALRIPEFDTTFHTDVEDFEEDQDLDVESVVDEEAMQKKLQEVAMGYGQVNEEICKIENHNLSSCSVVAAHSDSEQEHTDEEKCNTDGDDVSVNSDTIAYRIKFSPSISKFSGRGRGCSRLPLPLNPEEPLTDCENIDSSPEETPTKQISVALVQLQEQTDEEQFSDNDELRIDEADIELPPPTRNLILIEENDSLVPTIRILPLDSLEENHDEPFGAPEATDEESISDVEDILETANPRSASPDLPMMDGGLVRVLENENTPRNYIIPNTNGSITDTEVIILENKHKRRRAPKFKYMFEKSLAKSNTLSPSASRPAAALTDTEDLYFSDHAKEQKSCLKPQNPGESGLTDTENIDLSEDDLEMSGFRAASGHLRALEGDNVLLKESSRHEFKSNKKVFATTSTPASTDSEDMMASAEEDLEQLKNLDSEEVMYLKGGAYTDPETDIYFSQEEPHIGDLFGLKSSSHDHQNGNSYLTLRSFWSCFGTKVTKVCLDSLCMS